MSNKTGNFIENDQLVTSRHGRYAGQGTGLSNIKRRSSPTLHKYSNERGYSWNLQLFSGYLDYPCRLILLTAQPVINSLCKQRYKIFSRLINQSDEFLPNLLCCKIILKMMQVKADQPFNSARASNSLAGITLTLKLTSLSNSCCNNC